MKICDKNINFSIALEGACGNCTIRCKKNKVYSLEDIVPKGLCPFAYFSIIPYWVSFSQGAWFRWRETKNDVICQCPRPDGIVFLVKKIEQNGYKSIEAEIVNTGRFTCPHKYSVGDIFRIEQQSFCPALFPSLWSQLDKLTFSKELNIECCISPISIKVINLSNINLIKK